MSPYEDRARQIKVSALVERLWAGASDEQRRDPRMPWDIAQGDRTWWQTVADEAGVNLPSEVSRAAVVVELCKRVNSERRCATEPCERCKGRGWVNVRWGGNGFAEADGEGECPDCHGQKVELCENCDDEPAQLATPLRFYGAACTQQHYPAISRAARVSLDPFDGLTEADHFGASASPQLSRLAGGRLAGGRKVAGR